MHKDELTGSEVIDYDFLGKKLSPPKKVKVTDAGKAIERLFRELDRFHYPSQKNSKKEFHARAGNLRMQPCTIKMYYTKDKTTHREFLRDYLTQKNRNEVIEKPTLFNDEFEVVPESEIRRYEGNMVETGFKFIISPESQNIPMKQLAREFVSQLEKVTGHKFSWMAAIHTNTPHIHCHVLINGADKNTGMKFRFPPNIVKEVARGLASNICTQMVGERSREMIELSKKRLPFQKRWTTIDGDIATYGEYYQFDSIKNVDGNEYEAMKVTSDDIEIQRLNTLVEMGLAKCFKKEQPRKYYLEKSWKDKLKIIGRYNTYLEARNSLRWTPFCNLEQYTGKMGEISGIISKIYNMDYEGENENAIVIENKKLNKAWYIPTRIKLSNEDLGKFISVKAEKNAKGKLRPLLNIHK